jgi:hypothetical protein
MVKALESLATEELIPTIVLQPEAVEIQPEAVEIQPEAVEIQPEPAEVPEVPELPQRKTKASSKRTPRGQLVEQHLNQAWENGFRTYEQLMNYIELATGKSCSKSVSPAWKKSREASTEATAA